MERKAQYKKKINYIVEMQQLLTKPKNIDQRDALFYRVETAIEAAMDLIAMLIKDKGRTVGDDYHNIDTLLEIGILKSTLASELKKLNGLRNALVHRYNKFEETTVTQHTEQISSLLLDFVGVVENEYKKVPNRNT